MTLAATLAASTRVQVRLPNWLGDALMARPFLFALRRRAARARVTALGPAPVLDLLAADGTWDEAVAWPADAPARAVLRRGCSEVAFVLPPSFSSAWFAFRSGAAVRVGYAGDARSPLLTHARPRLARGERHLAVEYMTLLGGDSEPHEAPPLPPALDAGRGAGAEADAALTAAGVSNLRPLAIVAPGALYGPAKRWPAERFAALSRQLAASGHAVVACGGATERDACTEVARRSGGAATSLAGATSLRAQAALCARAQVVVSNDSGLAHLAGAVGARTVVVFGSTSSAWTAPLGARVRIVQRPPVCSPCFRRTCAIGYGCLDAVTVRDVERAIADLHESAGAGGGA